MSNYNKDGICFFRFGETVSIPNPFPCEPDPSASDGVFVVTNVTPSTITLQAKPERKR